MTKRTLPIETLILAGFADGRSLNSMCRQVGISRSAFLAWMHDDPDLTRRYEDAQICHAEALVDDCLRIADDPLIDLGAGRPGDVGPQGIDPMRWARFRMDARLRIARIYFKRHEAALARQMREEELLILAAEVEARAEEQEAPEANDESGSPAKAPPAARHSDESPRPIRLVGNPSRPEPTQRRAGSAP